MVISNSIKKLYDSESNDMGIGNIALNTRYLDNKKIDYNFFDFTGVSKPYEEFVARFI